MTITQDTDALTLARTWPQDMVALMSKFVSPAMTTTYGLHGANVRWEADRLVTTWMGPVGVESPSCASRPSWFKARSRG